MSASETVRIDDLSFIQFIPAEQIAQRVAAMALDIDKKLLGKEPVFLGILNGCLFLWPTW
ncbi:MAG TPA: hypothetical protein PKD40_09880 [Saprospiraceae bacterium]|nr:hypothetical protein [Saprospiraceae bacterium]